ncbi:MAG: dipeptidase [Lachnospiraceae bacterium]
MKVVDMHCDTIAEIRYSQFSQTPQNLAKNTLQIDLEKMKEGEYLLQNFGMFVDTSRLEEPLESVLHLIDLFYQEMEKNESVIRPIKSYADIIENEKNGRMSAMLTVEEGAVCKGDLAFLRMLYRLGVRMMTILWNYPNELGYPNIYIEDLYGGGGHSFDGSHGLTEKGLEFLAEMEKLGMIIDVSHLSDAGVWDVLHHTTKPFVASHSNARALCGHGRNLSDEMIRAIAERGGVIGLNYLGMFLTGPQENGKCPSRVKRMAEHARHIMNVGGRECLGLGSDFDGIGGDLEMNDCSKLQLLAEEFERQHFTTTEIEGIFYKNVLRLYRDVLK